MSTRSGEEIKPWRAFGASKNSTDGDGRVLLVTEKKCLSLLKDWMRKQPVPLRCKQMRIVDCVDYWKWSAC